MKTQMGMHQGRSTSVFANQYPTIMEVILELVQNSLDVCALKVWVYIDVRHNSRTVAVRDNGDGATVENFNYALKNIGCTTKKSDKFGRYGLGLVSPFGKCRAHYFTAVDKSTGEYNRWSFNSTMLEKAAMEVPISKVRINYNPEGTKTNDVPWCSEMRLEDVISDRIQGAIDLDELKRLIVQKYGIVMRELGTVVHFIYIDQRGTTTTSEITAEQRMGWPLPVVSYTSDRVCTTFKLYLADRTSVGRKGEVLFGEASNNYRVTAHQFCISVSNLLDSEIIQALRSGVFEGEITNSAITLSATRRGFEHNDALLEMLAGICVWFKEHGKAYLDEVEAENNETRYRELGMRTLPVLKNVLASARLHHLMQGFSIGSVGKNHAPVSHIPGSEFAGTAVKASGTSGQSSQSAESSSASQNEHRGHSPAVVGGGDSKRVRVKDGSSGLTLVYGEMPLSKELCTLNRQTGELTFNICHPDWVTADVSDTAIMKFQEVVALQQLILLGQPEEFQAVQSMPHATFNHLWAHYIVNADRIRGTRPGRPRKEKNSK